MDRTLSWLAGAHNPDATERALTEVDVAIGMVVLGAAVTVRLCNLEAVQEAAFDAAARAQAAGVAFSLKRDGPKSITLIVGPMLESERPHDGARAEPAAPTPEASA